MKLIITNPHAGSRELHLTSSASIGRSGDNTIQIDEPTVARYHAMIERRGNDFWLNDLGSSNGTILNGMTLTAEQPLKFGDTISLGGTTAIRVVPAEPAPQPVAQTASPNDSAPAASNESQPASSPPATAPAENGVSLSHMAVAGVMVFLVLGFVGLGVWIIRGKSQERTAQNGTPTYYTPTPIAKNSITNSDGTKPTPTQAPTKTVVVSQNVATGIEGLVSRLAGQLSGRGNYIFDPEMIAQIAARTSEYRVDVTPLAQPYKLEVQRAFSTAKGLNPLYGHILAMSQSKYGQTNSGGIGIWQIPPTIAKDYVAGGTDLSALNSPQRSADLAASHLQELLPLFDSQDFMYALACFGLPKSKAGEMNQRLQTIDPGDRRDFWKQVKAGLVPRDGAEKVVRFFAAGIVGEYPASFGLTGATAFSEL
ncbi:MAG TPA: FHA domain-containing protein [Blastocatellia bacterium]|nr:FHA domain-containing protein [Blastocatellia bacterium]